MPLLRPPLLAAGLAGALLLCGCSKLPSDMSPYAGAWRSDPARPADSMLLIIGADGNMSYLRRKGRSHIKIEAPVQSFDGQGFSAGLLFLSTRFQIDRPPFERDGRRFVVIDGVELALEAPASPGPSSQP